MANVLSIFTSLFLVFRDFLKSAEFSQSVLMLPFYFLLVLGVVLLFRYLVKSL